MRYSSFSAREYFVLKKLPIEKNSLVLEIGVGLGIMADMLLNKVKEYHGVDISRATIDYLEKFFRGSDSVNWHCLDVCEDFSLPIKFDIVFSIDTLEHTGCPGEFFKFVQKHLKNDSIALILFPNESAERHHGITWFEQKKEILDFFEGAGLKSDKILEIRETFWHHNIKKFFWNLPKKIILRSQNNPQIFEETAAFNIIQSRGLKTKIFSLYARIITRIALFFPLYSFSELREDVKNKTLLFYLKKK